MILASTLSTQMGDLLANAGPILFYLVVWGLVFAGTGLFVGVFIPFITGDSLLFAAGLVTAAASDTLNVWVLAIGVGIAAFVGDQVGFIMGRHLGRPYLDKKAGPRMSRLIVRVDRFYLKYGWWSVVVARFMPWARVLIPWIAGIGKMNYTKFLTSNLVGAVAWGVGLSVVGFFAASIPSVRVAAYIIGGSFITLSIIFGLRTWLQDRRERREQLAQSELSAST
jgi:membrane-associated protein